MRALFYSFCKLFTWAFLKLYNGLEVRGVEHIPKSGPFLLASTHHSNLDPVAVGSACPRRLRFLAKRELFSNRAFGWLISALGAIPLPRGEVGMAAMKEALKVLSRGEGLLIFPEGTRGPEGAIRPLQEGVAFLALKASVPVVPCLIRGSSFAMPRGSSFVRPFRIRVLFGKPLYPVEGESRSSFLYRLRCALEELLAMP